MNINYVVKARETAYLHLLMELVPNLLFSQTISIYYYRSAYVSGL